MFIVIGIWLALAVLASLIVYAACVAGGRADNARR